VLIINYNYKTTEVDKNAVQEHKKTNSENTNQQELQTIKDML